MEATKAKLSDELRDRRDVRGGHAQDPWDSRFAATRTYERADAHAQHAPSADGVEDRLRELADTVKNLRASLSMDTTSDAVEQLSETVLGELRRRNALDLALYAWARNRTAHLINKRR